ncbi:MAG: hypothetical protein HC941_32700 [Microcoleus sp. SU_5_3]|nr:hypothetical protein [Microcoleus sp. SU_5_3]
MLKTLPKTLTAHYEIRVLGDSDFGSIEMLKWVKNNRAQIAIIQIIPVSKINSIIKFLENYH